MPKVHPEKEGIQIGFVHSNWLHREFEDEQHSNLRQNLKTDKRMVWRSMTFWLKCPLNNAMMCKDVHLTNILIRVWLLDTLIS